MFNSNIPETARSAILLSQRKAPVKVVSLAHQLGIKVFKDSLGQISGKLSKDPRSLSGWSITVNENEAEVRRRFTIAHEIGHFLLHKDKVGESIEDDTFYRSALSNKLEAEANMFAADLLMPWALINELTDSGINTAKRMADVLKVSEIAMSIRLGIPT